MNTQLLKQVADVILARPRQVEMRSWFERRDGAGDCGTTACIAGWVLTLADPANESKPLKAAVNLNPRMETYSICEISWAYADQIRPSASKALGISREQALELFLDENWPNPFRSNLNLYKSGSPEYARVVYDRIMHFIATDGAE